MKKIAYVLSIVALLGGGPSVSRDGLAQNHPWRKVEEGLFWAEFRAPFEFPLGGVKIDIVKVDPRFYSFKLLCASELGKVRLTPKGWCQKHELVSAINAGMYQKDGLTNVGYMRNFSHVNNPRLNSVYKAVLAFNRVEWRVPEIQIIDLACQEFEELKPKYQTLVQNLRMINCRQENVWSKGDKRWSLAVLGMDRGGNALFIFSETPCPVYDFNQILLSLPIFLFNAMYLEGGPEASLFLSANGLELDRVGTHETGGSENTIRAPARPVPNVIGITKKVKH